MQLSDLELPGTRDVVIIERFTEGYVLRKHRPYGNGEDEAEWYAEYATLSSALREFFGETLNVAEIEVAPQV